MRGTATISRAVIECPKQEANPGLVEEHVSVAQEMAEKSLWISPEIHPL